MNAEWTKTADGQHKKVEQEKLINQGKRHHKDKTLQGTTFEQTMGEEEHKEHILGRYSQNKKIKLLWHYSSQRKTEF